MTHERTGWHLYKEETKTLVRNWLLAIGILVAVFAFQQTAKAETPPQMVIAPLVAKSGHFLVRDHIVIDLQNAVEWMRCSVGQQWDGKTCAGEAVALNHDEIAKAIVIANEQVGPGWRLPSLAELEGLVCETCAPVKIELDSFPNTMAEPYWTGEVNSFASRHIWSVNFMTGHTYGRFFPTQRILVRLVRDR
jgi:hypothetical protein